MKRTVFVSLFLVTGALLPGCPIYDDDGCTRDSDCPETYQCDGALGLCYPPSDSLCSRPSECDANETCSRAGLCRQGDCSWSDIGCIVGYECSNQNGLWACVREGTGGGEGGNAGAGGAAGATSSGGTPSTGGAASGGAPPGTGGAT